MIIREKVLQRSESSARSLVNNTILVGTNMLFPILLIPYISRVLGPENLGIFNWSSAVISYLLTFATIGLPTIGIREIGKFRSDPTKINSIVDDIFSIRLVLAAIGYATLLLLCNYSVLFHKNEIVLYILSAQIFFELLSNDWVYVGLSNQLIVMIRNSISKVLLVISVYLAVSGKEAFFTFVILYVLSYCLPYLLNYLLLFKKYRPHFSFISIKKYYSAEVLINFLLSIVTTFYGKVDIIFLGMLMSMYDLGIISTIYKLISVVLVFVTSWAIVLLPRSSNLFHNDRARFFIFINKSMDLVLLNSLFATVFLMFNSKEILLIFLGEKFAGGFWILSLLSPLIVIISIYNLMTYQILYLDDKFTEILIVMSIALVSYVVLVFALYSRLGTDVIVYSILGSNIFILAMIYSLVYRRHKLTFLDMNKAKIVSANICLAPVCYFSSELGGGLPSMALKGLLLLLAYVVLLLLMRENIAMGIMQKVRES